MSNDDTWFKDLIRKVYDDLFDPACSLYLPNVIDKGYNNSELDIHIVPRNSVPLRDINNAAGDLSLPGGCGLDYVVDQSVAYFSGHNNVLACLDSVGKAVGYDLKFSQDDSVVQVPLTFASVEIKGDLTLSQLCKDSSGTAYTKTYTGAYTVTISNLTLLVTANLQLNDKITATIHPINFAALNLLPPHSTPHTQMGIKIDGQVNDPPPNIETWWIELANAPDIINKIQSALEDGLTGSDSEKWIESVVNGMLTQIPFNE